MVVEAVKQHGHHGYDHGFAHGLDWSIVVVVAAAVAVVVAVAPAPPVAAVCSAGVIVGPRWPWFAPPSVVGTAMALALINRNRRRTVKAVGSSSYPSLVRVGNGSVNSLSFGVVIVVG